MTPPPRFPWHDPADALDALRAGTFWARTRRWADHMDAWLATPRPPLGRQAEQEQECPHGKCGAPVQCVAGPMKPRDPAK